jgi:hypothetical protein
LSEWQGIRQIKNLDLRNELNVYSVNGRIGGYIEKWVTTIALRNLPHKVRSRDMVRPRKI